MERNFNGRTRRNPEFLYKEKLYINRIQVFTKALRHMLILRRNTKTLSIKNIKDIKDMFYSRPKKKNHD